MYDWREAERQIAAWMRENIDPAATLTGAGADGGVDIRAPGIVAQVKAMTRGPAGRPELQRLLGVASVEHAQPLFFSMSGFSQQAIAWGEAHAMALYSFHPDGRVKPETTFARKLIGRPPVMPMPAPTSTPLVDSHGRTWKQKRRRGCLFGIASLLVTVVGGLVAGLVAEASSNEVGSWILLPAAVGGTWLLVKAFRAIW